MDSYTHYTQHNHPLDSSCHSKIPKKIFSKFNGIYIYIFLFLGDEPTHKKNTQAIGIGQTIIRRLMPKEFIRNSAVTILTCTTVCPFRFSTEFLCFYCSTTFPAMPPLVSHTKTKHGSLTEKDIRKALVRKAKMDPLKVNVDENVCKLCNKETEDFDQLKKHLVDEHDKKMDVNDCGVIPFCMNGECFKCVHCKENFDSYRSLCRHVNTHYKKYYCEQCNAGFVAQSRLRDHMFIHKGSSNGVGVVPKKLTGTHTHTRTFQQRLVFFFSLLNISRTSMGQWMGKWILATLSIFRMSIS